MALGYGNPSRLQASRLRSSLWYFKREAECVCASLDLLYGSLIDFFADLIIRVPGFSGDLGVKARERVALRCLEDLVGPGNAVTNGEPSSPTNSRIGFDVSLRCEDVLQRILSEIDESNPRVARRELWRWDIQSFIFQKRASLSKCALIELKDAIIDGSHPCTTSLRVRSGLAKESEDEKIYPVGPYAADQKIDENTIDGKVQAGKNNDISFNHEDVFQLLQEDPPDRPLTFFKRDRSVLAEERLVESLQESSDDDHANIKRLKQGPKSGAILFIRQNSVPVCENEPLEDPSESIILPDTVKSCGLEKETQLQGFEKSNVFVDNDNYTSKKHEHVTDDDEVQQAHHSCGDEKMPQGSSLLISANDDEFQHNRPLDTCEKKKMPEHPSADGADQNVSVDETKVDHEHCICDDGHHHNENIDLTERKNKLLCSQNTLSQNVCTKCNTGGQLLVCSGVGCPLVVHESCLGSSASLDERGNFFCPFCLYASANTEYLEAKEKASLARKELAKFSGVVETG